MDSGMWLISVLPTSSRIAKAGHILDFQETATVRYLVKFKEPKRRGIRASNH